MSNFYAMLRCPSVLDRTATSRSQLYQDIADGLFTSGVSIGGRAVAWPAYEVDAINAARIAGYSSTQLRELVQQLLAARKNVVVMPRFEPETPEWAAAAIR